MKTLSLTPYPGHVHLFKKEKSLSKKYEKLTGNKYPYEATGEGGGRYIFIEGEGWFCFLVLASEVPVLAHEFTHCLLKLFEIVGIDPREANGEPMCYMLSRLMAEALEGK